MFALVFLVMPGQKRDARLGARRPGHPRLARTAGFTDVYGRDKPGHDELGTERFASARLRQQRQLPRLRLVLGVIGEVRGIDAGEAMVREFRI